MTTLSGAELSDGVSILSGIVLGEVTILRGVVYDDVTI
jgi:hypothetical protein